MEDKDGIYQKIVGIETKFLTLEERFLTVEAKLDSTAGDIKRSLDRLVDTIEANLAELVKALAGVDRIPTAVMTKIVAIFGIVIVGLVVALVFVLTGLNLGYLPVNF